MTGQGLALPAGVHSPAACAAAACLQAGANGTAPVGPIELSELTAVGPLDG